MIPVSRAGSETAPFATCLGSTGPGTEPAVAAQPSTLTASLGLGFHPPARKVWRYGSPAKRWSGRALPLLEKHSASEGAWNRVFLPSVTPGQIANPRRWQCRCCLAKGKVERLENFNLKSQSLTHLQNGRLQLST